MVMINYVNMTFEIFSLVLDSHVGPDWWIL